MPPTARTYASPCPSPQHVGAVEGVASSLWTVTGKVSEVIFIQDTNHLYDLAFRYDPMGNRIAKISKPKATPGDKVTWTITWYARDAQGNVLAVYSKQTATNNFSIAEFSIFGSKRIGVVTNPEQLTQPVIDPPTPYSYSFEAGMKQYEFSNHASASLSTGLGNVLSTFTDRKYPQDDFSYTALPSGDYEYNATANFYYYVGAGNGNYIQSPGSDGFIDYYTAQLTSATDYYPFGMQMPGRVFNGGGYRWGFNSMEKDDELKGTGNSYDFGARLYDPRVGRWLAVDPLAGKYPDLSSYAFTGNCPVLFIDPDGKKIEIYYKTGEKDADGNEVISCWEYKPGLGVPDNNYVINVVSQLTILYSISEGQELIDGLVANDQHSVRIFQKIGNEDIAFEIDDPIAARENNIYHAQTRNHLGQPIGKHDSEYPIGSGGVIRFDPYGFAIGGLSFTGSPVAPAIIALAHELFHASQSFSGDIESSIVYGFGIGQDEFEAVHFENIIRASLGLVLRQWYDQEQKCNGYRPLVNDCGSRPPAQIIKNNELHDLPEYNYLQNHPPPQ